MSGCTLLHSIYDWKNVENSDLSVGGILEIQKKARLDNLMPGCSAVFMVFFRFLSVRLMRITWNFSLLWIGWYSYPHLTTVDRNKRVFQTIYATGWVKVCCIWKKGRFCLFGSKYIDGSYYYPNLSQRNTRITTLILSFLKCRESALLLKNEDCAE